MVIEYTSYPWVSMPAKFRQNLYDMHDYTDKMLNEILVKYKAKYKDGFVLFENVKYYTILVLEWG